MTQLSNCCIGIIYNCSAVLAVSVSNSAKCDSGLHHDLCMNKHLITGGNAFISSLYETKFVTDYLFYFDTNVVESELDNVSKMSADFITPKRRDMENLEIVRLDYPGRIL